MMRRLFVQAVVACSLTCSLAAGALAAQTPIIFSLDFRALGRHAAWYLALDKGYYKEAGLDVTIVPSQGTADAVQRVESGVAQFGFADVAAVVSADANSKATARMIAVIYQKAPYAIYSLRSGADLTKPSQLEGLEIGSGAGSFTQKVIQAFAVEHKLDPTKINFTNIDPSARVGMLVSKRVPAIETFIMSQPGLEKAAGDHQLVTFLLADYGMQIYSNGIVAKASYLKTNPGIAEAFVKASLEGWREAIAHPNEALKAVLKYNKALDPQTALQEIKIVNNLVAAPYARAQGLGAFDPALMQRSIDLVAGSEPKAKGLKASDIAEAGYLPDPPIKPAK